ncbi:WD40 repeat domain-containing protein [Nitratifractor salsuginis]|uniref:Periplasmic nitrate reductase component NapL n=1 Tax=Nitratifractor salsuginis (strain DSM 16511 / JCM 12458 / E9I37-1) TaxID=749222 RepID=E6X0K0_NITSE|nr:periplasmic nitrate reductase component napl [Nitratifractor salsuginis]ADV46850.1 periplasmic nitrate reductase component NapL [Nitratifractor salsuginis DSM 16511]
MRYLFSLIALLGLVMAGSLPTVAPQRQIEADGAVNDIVLSDDGALIAGTDHGSLQRIDLQSFKVETLLHLPQVKDFMGDKIDDKVFSVDELGGRYLILSDSGQGGFSDLRILENGKVTKLFGAEERHSIVKARFVDKNHILYATLGNEAVLYEIGTGKELYREQLSESKFSDFSMDSRRKRAVFGCESGELTVIETATGKILKRIEKLHVDNVFSVDIRQDWVIAGAQDRRASYYNLSSGEHGYFKSDFLIYAVALSPAAKTAAYAMHDDNSITLYHLDTKTPFALLKGQKSILTRIVFKDETTLFSASHDPSIMLWKIKP